MTQRPSYLAFNQVPCRSSLSNTATGMALHDFYERERLLKDEQSTMSRNGSGTGSDSIMFGSTGSYSSGWSSPFGSELGSTETEGEEDEDGGEFIAELTRQMTDYMLEEEEEDENAATKTLTGSDSELGPTERHGRRLQSPIRTSTSCPAHGSKGFFDDPSQAVHLYKLENQPVANQQDSVCWGRRMTRTELTQHKKPHHKKSRGRRSDAASGGGGGGGFGPQLQQRRQQQVGSGSGMRAVFLGGPPSSSNGSCGTGVFLPRGTNPVEVRKKSDCSTVLIPARVLQTLQLHFENMNSRSQSNSRLPQHDAANDTNPNHSQSRTRQVVNHHDMGLPQEWTY